MYHIYLVNNTIQEIIPSEDPVFPDIPIEQRYSAEFLAHCITAGDVSGIHPGMIRKADGTFTEPPTPVPVPVPVEPSLAEVQAAKLTEINAACDAAITSGCDVTLSDGTAGHISLTAEDQINLTTAQTAITGGAEGYPYHLDGQLCKIYPGTDILAMARAATAHILYHATYCNHLHVWVSRCVAVSDVEGIAYGCDLPADLAANMEGILATIGGGNA